MQLPDKGHVLHSEIKESGMTDLHFQSGVPPMLAGAVLSVLNGVLYSWSVFMLPLEAAGGWTRAQTSLVFTVALVFFGLGMMCGGFVIRLVGTRVTAAVGGSMLAAGLVLSSCASVPWQLILAYGVTAGFGIGMANVVPTAVGVSWYPHRRGLVCGVMAFSLASGTLLLGSGVASTLIGVMGVGRTLQTLGLFVALASLAASFFLKMPERRKIEHRENCFADSLTTPQMLRSVRFRLVWLWDLALQTGGLMIIGHIIPYATESGCSPAQAGFAMGVYAVVNGIGRLVFGSLFDRKGFRFSMAVDALCMAAGLIMLTALPECAGYAGLLAGVSTIALSFGGTIPQFSAYIAQNFGPKHLESNLGMTATVFIIAGFAGPFFGGCLREMTGSYSMALVTAALVALPGCWIVFKIPETATYE